jgi:predicted MFS family arabinose efflux permease
MPSPLKRVLDAIKAGPLGTEADFRMLWSSQIFSAAGYAGEQVVLGLLVYRITGSSEWVGISLAIYYMPLFIAGTLSGAIADWMDRRRLLRLLELGFLSAQVLFAATLVAGFDALWVMLVASFAFGVLRAMHQPVRVSYAYDLIGGGRVVSAIGTLNLGIRSGQLVGSLAAGTVMELFGAPGAFLTLASGHAVAWLLVGRLRSAGRASVAATDRAPIGRNLLEYISELRNNRILLMLVLLTASVELFGFSFQTGLPQLAEGRLQVGADGLGQLQAARAAGGVVASLLLMLGLGWLARPGRVYLGVIVLFGIGMIAVSVSNHFLLAMLALFLVSGMATASDILTQSMLQLSVPNALRGRAMGAWSLAIGVSPIGQMEMGFLIGSFGLGAAYAFNGCVLIAIALIVAIAVPGLRRL